MQLLETARQSPPCSRCTFITVFVEGLKSVPTDMHIYVCTWVYVNMCVQVYAYTYSQLTL